MPVYDPAMKKLMICLATTAALLTACGSDPAPEQSDADRIADIQESTAKQVSMRKDLAIETCHDATRDILKDPDSAEFRKDFAVDTGVQGLEWVVTGQVNANNSFGGKVGFTPYRCNANYDPATNLMKATSKIA